MVAIDYTGYSTDELNNDLSSVVSWSSLASDHDHTRYKLRGALMRWSVLDGQVAMHNVQDVHKLSLVLVDALNLDIVQGVKWDIDASLLLDELLELHFVLTLDLAEASDEFLAVSVVAQLTQSIHITDPLIDTADSLRDQL